MLSSFLCRMVRLRARSSGCRGVRPRRATGRGRTGAMSSVHGDREFLDAVDEVGAEAAGRAGLAEAGVAAGELFEEDAEFQFGEVVAEAEVGAAAAEADLRVGVAADVEDLGVLEDGGVAVGGAVEDDDLVVFLDVLAA